MAAPAAATQTITDKNTSLQVTKPPAGTEREIYLKDYQPYPYEFEELRLEFDIGTDKTIVFSKIAVSSKSASCDPMVLDGEDLELKGIYINSKPLSDDEYKLGKSSLTILKPPQAQFTLGVVTEIYPHKNTKLEGLYKSSGNYCTQCEAQGFRRITYYPDRPDVLTTFTTKIVASKQACPVLLSNGNLAAQGDMDNGRHFAVWIDPFPKPCYLFALVAGQLVALEDTFETMSGRSVDLRIWTEAHNAKKTNHAMVSLKKAMKWDEERFGREYDLDLFNIVAVDDFTMGAMENKSLNVFNSRVVLASPETTTDFTYDNIERVVGHEYFHNWTGNRVTCRDWFQLSLKEGLTVYRDQEFSCDLNSRPVVLIKNVKLLRSSQFPEDSGPIAHPVRPASYQKIDNFYTVTVYKKGAQVIRMYDTLLGKEGFRKGMDLYFERHDGQAVTIDDFYSAMCDANDKDLDNFKLWYSQAGTPTVQIEYSWVDEKPTFKYKQFLPSTPGSPSQEKKAMLIPLKLGLLDPNGDDIPINEVTFCNGTTHKFNGETTVVIPIKDMEGKFEIPGLNCAARPVPSMLRSFSAPVTLNTNLSVADRLFLLAHDSDPFNRWESGQQVCKDLVKQLVAEHGKAVVADEADVSISVPAEYTDALRNILKDNQIDDAFKALCLELPTVSEMVTVIEKADPIAVYKILVLIKKSIAQALRYDLLAADADTSLSNYSIDAAAKGKRALRNIALAIVSSVNDETITNRVKDRFSSANNMTDQESCLRMLCGRPSDKREEALSSFYNQWKEDSLVMLIWLSVQARSEIPGNLEKVRALMDHSAFDIKNPNKVYSLLGTFSSSAMNFHARDGSGYNFFAEAVLKVDKVNPQVAARIAAAFTKWRQYDEDRQKLMCDELKRMMEKDLSPNLYEIVSKSL